MDELRRTGRVAVGDGDGDGDEYVLTPEQSQHLDEAEAHFLGSTEHLTRMLVMGSTFSGVLASMHWTLVEFSSALIVTSDEPVVMWPQHQHARVPQATPTTTGVLATIEVRVPGPPTRMLLMTWSDGFDDDDNRVEGSVITPRT